MAKVIEVKPDVLNVPMGPVKVTLKFKDFLISSIDSYGPVGKSRKMMRQANKIEDAINAGNGTIVLEDSDYELLVAALHIKDEVADFNPTLRRLEREGWFLAVENAQEVTK